MTASPGGPATLLVVTDLAKRFGSTQALAGADLIVREREVVAVLGESGSGKTTLLDIVSGLHRADAGTLVFRGFPISLKSRHDAVRIGLAVVEQEPALIPDLSVYDNIVLPAFGRLAHLRPADLRKRVAGLLTTLGVDGGLPLSDPAHRLTASQAHLVALARVMVTRAKLYLFDEPFASLSPREVDGLVGTMMRLRMAGCGIVIATRRLDEVSGFADRIMWLAGGRTALTANPHDAEEIGRLRRAVAPAASVGREESTGRPRLVLQGLGAKPSVSEVSLAVRAGEIVVLHGLKGAGCAAAVAAAAGARPRTSGTVTLDGTALAGGSRRAVGAGLGFSDPARPLLLPGEPVRAALALVAPADGAGIAALWQSLRLPDGGLDRPADAEPAGVRRRIALLPALLAGRAAILLADPTRGLQPEERQAVHDTLRAAARAGRAVLLSCTDRDEALSLADRCVVMREGRAVADLSCAALDGETLGLLATPPTTLARHAAMLAELTRENGGAAFWAVLREDRVICLATAIADADADPGLKASASAAFDDTRIPTALRQGGSEFVAEPEGGRSTVLVPIRTLRGRPFGLIGLTLGPGMRPPPAAAVAFRIETLAAAR